MTLYFQVVFRALQTLYSFCRQDQSGQLVEVGLLALLVLPVQVRRRRGTRLGQVLVAQARRGRRRPEHGRHGGEIRQEGQGDPAGD